jgi:hypothetical protein
MRFVAFLVALSAAGLATRVASADPVANGESVTVSRADYRTAGWFTLGVGSAGAALGLVGLAFAQGSCSSCPGCGCAGGNWGWSVAGAIVAGVALPIGIVLVLQKDTTTRSVAVRPLAAPASYGLSVETTF